MKITLEINSRDIRVNILYSRGEFVYINYIDKTNQERSARRKGREAAAAAVYPAVINNGS